DRDGRAGRGRRRRHRTFRGRSRAAPHARVRAARARVRVAFAGVIARERVALGVLLSAIALGVLGDYLFQGRTLGVNAGVFALAFVAALSLLLRVGRIPLHQGRRAMVAPLVLFAGLLAWHDSPLLLATNLLAVAGAVAIGALRRTKPNLVVSSVPDLAHLWSHLLIGAAVAWLACGLPRDLLATRDDQRLVASELASLRTPKRLLIGPTEIAVALAIVNVLFAAFVAVLIRYLFGGRGLVDS